MRLHVIVVHTVSETVFFKHKYLTMPTITPEAALLKAVDDLKNAIEGNIPPSLQTKEGVEKLMKIFKGYATESTDHTAKPTRSEQMPRNRG